ncbi:tail fiber protein [Aquimarina aquimarini]|uniref:tail fiber protein n=1 Tax=Aquimarina aquimarini TaxID=1191734 RepID=UPI001F28D9B9|nr:tail fiber protein [Aquimarina aquimarini]
MKTTIFIVGLIIGIGFVGNAQEGILTGSNGKNDFTYNIGNINIGGQKYYDYRLSISKGNKSSRLAFINSGFPENAVLEYHTSKQLRFQKWMDGVWNGTLMSIDYVNGNVGIGTTDLKQNLSVKDERPRIALVDNNGDAGVIEFYNVTNQIRFQKWLNSGGSFDKTIMALSGDNGFVGIGTTKPDMKLTVKGNIHAEEVKIDLNIPAPDYVFKEDYNLISIKEVENFIKKNSHLPEIPSAKEFEQNGVMQAEMDMNLLKKIEELTLYTIQQQKEIESLKKENEEVKLLNTKLIELQSRLEKLESKK